MPSNGQYPETDLKIFSQVDTYLYRSARLDNDVIQSKPEVTCRFDYSIVFYILAKTAH